MSPEKLKYLEMIQSVITRMAANQMQLRTWSVTLGVAVIGYAASKDGHPHAALLALLPAFTFWLQDGYYLTLERKFRGLYDRARVAAEPPDMSMDFGGLSAGDWLRGCSRPAVWLVHLPVAVLALVVGAWPCLR
jgi:hypothetical protein